MTQALAVALPHDAFNARDVVNIAHALSRSSLPVPPQLLAHLREAALLSLPAAVEALAARDAGGEAGGVRLGDWHTNSACMMVAALARLGYWHPVIPCSSPLIPDHPLLIPAHPCSSPDHPRSSLSHPRTSLLFPRSSLLFPDHPLLSPDHPLLIFDHPLLIPAHPCSSPDHPRV